MHDENPRPDESRDEEIPLPVGTLFLMMLYIMVMAGMWLAMYFEFLGR
jgi:quinol-cytochrome oxidoreductase complex cytochrome b subunit